MRNYIARIIIKKDDLQLETGILGEKIFKHWFENNYQEEKIFKQKQDRDYEGIDFADEKGYTYQIKTTTKRSYTFNCDFKDVSEHLIADLYIFIQIKDNVAYIESINTKENIVSRMQESYKYGNSFVYAEDLLQQKIFDYD